METGANTQKEPGWENEGQRIARGIGSGGRSADSSRQILRSRLSQDKGTKKGRGSKVSLTLDMGGCAGNKEVSSSLPGPCTELRPPPPPEPCPQRAAPPLSPKEESYLGEGART